MTTAATVQTRLHFDHQGVCRLEIFDTDVVEGSCPGGGFWRSPSTEEARIVAAAIEVRHGITSDVKW